jgi:AraC family transcriptional regulator
MTTPTNDTYRQRILRVQHFIREHLDEELPLDRLARVAHFSPYHFHRIFKGLVGEGVHEYVRRVRLESAARALRRTCRSIIQIAFEAGYAAHEAFTRAFRQQFGVSPTRYRNGEELPPGKQKESDVMAAATKSRDVRIEQVPPRRVAYLRHLGPYAEVGPTYGRLLDWARRRGLMGPEAQLLSISYDDPEVTPPEKIRCDCCIAVDEQIRPEGDVGLQTVEGGEYAVIRHCGPSTEVHDTMRWLFGVWLPASGREPRNAPLYSICNDPPGTPPDRFCIDIYVPLEPVHATDPAGV